MFYLKYRPQTIAELDSERIKETLGKNLLENNWAHAYLLIGTRGSGKTTTARLIAKIVNCTNRQKGDEPCNKCDSCKAITSGTSLDTIEIDAASNTGVDDIRDLREKVKLAPSSSKYKVYIIDEVHMLSTSAFNALLKTLEEPPEHVIFVLATTDPQKIPATISSRCLVFDFGKASEKEIISSLKRKIKNENLEVEDKVVEEIAQEASGSFRDADKFLEQLALQGKKITLKDLEKFADKGNISTTVEKVIAALEKQASKPGLEAIENYVRNNGRVKELMVGLVDYLRNILLLRSGIPTELEEIELDNSKVQNLLKSLIEASALIKDSPVLQLPLEMVIVEFCQNEKLSDSDGTQKSQKEPENQIPREPEISDQSEISGKSEATDPQTHRVSSDISSVASKWPEILAGVKPYNHSLVALLRGSRPKEMRGDFLTLEVFYKFHKDKLSESKNREILEKVISAIIGVDTKIKFELSEKKGG